MTADSTTEVEVGIAEDAILTFFWLGYVVEVSVVQIV